MLSLRATAISRRGGLFTPLACAPFFPCVKRKHRGDNNNLHRAHEARGIAKESFALGRKEVSLKESCCRRDASESTESYVRANGRLENSHHVTLLTNISLEKRSPYKYFPEACGFNTDRTLI